LRYETLLYNKLGTSTCNVRVRAIIDNSLTPSECHAAYPMKCAAASYCRPQQLSSSSNWTEKLLLGPTLITRPQLNLEYYTRDELLEGLNNRVDSSNYCECPTGSFGYDCSISDTTTESFAFNNNYFTSSKGQPINITLSASNTNRKFSFTLSHLANLAHSGNNLIAIATPPIIMSLICNDDCIDVCYTQTQSGCTGSSCTYQVCYNDNSNNNNIDCTANADTLMNTNGALAYGYCMYSNRDFAEKFNFYTSRTIVRARVGTPLPHPVMRYDVTRFPADRVSSERAGLFRVGWTMIGSKNDTNPTVPIYQRIFEAGETVALVEFDNGDTNMTININTYLYVDIIVEGYQEVEGGDDGYGNTYGFRYHVTWKITDAVGDTVGAIAILILGGVFLSFLTYLCVKSRRNGKDGSRLGCGGAFKSLFERGMYLSPFHWLSLALLTH
jgi:hypothetical protein